MSLDELLGLKVAADGGWVEVDYTNMDLLCEHITFRLEIVERLERTLNMAASGENF
jgi:hypothetical protein